MVPRAYSFGSAGAISLLGRTRYEPLPRFSSWGSGPARSLGSGSAAISGYGRSRDVFGALVGEPKNKIGDIDGLQPLRKIRAGHCFAVCRCVHRAGKDYVGGQSRVLVLQRYRANKAHQRGLEGDVGREAGVRLNGRKAADRDDAT